MELNTLAEKLFLRQSLLLILSIKFLSSYIKHIDLLFIIFEFLIFSLYILEKGTASDFTANEKHFENYM